MPLVRLSRRSDRADYTPDYRQIRGPSKVFSRRKIWLRGRDPAGQRDADVGSAHTVVAAGLSNNAALPASVAPVGEQNTEVGLVRVAVRVDVARTASAGAAPIRQQNAQVGLIHTAVAVQITGNR